MPEQEASPTVRPASAHDAPAIAHTHVVSWRSAYPGIVPQPYLDALDIEEFAERWSERLTQNSGMHIHVAEQAGAVCGFAAGGPSRGTVPDLAAELYALYLLPSAQRQGLGARLFWSVAQALQLLGNGSMFVWVLEQNPSRGFYEHMGGLPCGEASIVIGGHALTEVAYGWPDIQTAFLTSRKHARNR